MLATLSGTQACPDIDRHRRLAVQLADMIPGAATVRVDLTDPQRRWPHPHATVKDEAGKTMALGRTTTTVAARWVFRTWPEADWTRPHIFHLADATLTHGESTTAGRGH
ncbi:transcriptional regulator [Streptomyces buecherae]|uniref:Transcriptional regulator n=1 Tax=Streptomyces buecherae TaxID=2763006 RepID=A0A7H8NGE1_9ACTN|nr:transcriptional regulator [Streptomyces buecherae]QKW53573.1 transcriptional regulator [Streptomyces buecherae]